MPNLHFSQAFQRVSWPILLQADATQGRCGSVAQASACVVFRNDEKPKPHRLKPVLLGEGCRLALDRRDLVHAAQIGETPRTECRHKQRSDSS
jgi:hypothetical protein